MCDEESSKSWVDDTLYILMKALSWGYKAKEFVIE